MIKIIKGNKPEILEINEQIWTEEYIKLMNGDESIPKIARFRYRHKDIKSALRDEANDKCIFCESKISHTFPGETDHIIPASKDYNRIVEWTNLGYVCKECNMNKSDYHDLNIPLLNPFIDSPNDSLIFFGPLVLAKGGSVRGQITVDLLDLSRPAIIERKKERIDRVKALLDRALAFPEGDAKNFLMRKVHDEALADKEYSATIKAYLTHAI
ncbi:HNH endonuclease [Agaribacter marinus]|uniref:HNH endonuclease 5 domain-containing protein n=1 Tax=Agaribacter marinus TaxID=1431249 RepID=A0AA37T1M0_9ALTE|nr:HNH endonuclease [Agaribacter marinus]GLR72195.1 hypothetical protein GCM10007852_31030 [Agaribacter marinus]